MLLNPAVTIGRDEADLLTTAEAARTLGVSPATLKRWVHQGLLDPHRTPGGHGRFAAEEVRALAARRSGLKGPVRRGADYLVEAGSSVKVHGWLLAMHRELGSWRGAEPQLADILAELYRRRATGVLGGVQLEAALDRLRVALIRSLDSTHAHLGAPMVLVASLEGDPHAVVPALLQLIATESGWQALWAGRPSRHDLEIELQRRRVRALVLCSSPGAPREVLEKAAQGFGRASLVPGVPTAILSRQRWPVEPEGISRYASANDAADWLGTLKDEAPHSQPSEPQRRWHGRLEFGVPAIDVPRDAILEVATRLRSAEVAGADVRHVRAMVEFLVAELPILFEAEEASMRSLAYPKRDAHAAQHRRFLQGLAALLPRAGIEPSEPRHAAGIALVESWLQEHVGQCDLDLAEFTRIGSSTRRPKDSPGLRSGPREGAS